MYDAIIVGARCAGSPLAMLLARKGYRVLAVDKSTFPSDAISTHNIHQPGAALLKEWGLLDRIIAAGTPPITHMSFDVGPFALEGSVATSGDVVAAYAPRRKYLDKILFDAAIEAGAEVREAFSVEDVLTEGTRVVGVRGSQRGGAPVTEHARIIIGADGVRSRVAERVKAPVYNARPSYTAIYYTYWNGVETNGTELYTREGRFVVAAPTNDGLTMVCVVWPKADFNRVRADIENEYMKALDESAPSLAERVRAGRRAERFYGSGENPSYFRKAFGPGWALVGDAGYHKDPITAQGITDSFRQAKMLAETIDEWLCGRRTMLESLARFEQERNASALPMYELTCNLAKLSAPEPEMKELFGALRGNQAETNRFFGTIAGTVSIQDFYAPKNIRRIIDGAHLKVAA